MIIDRYPNWAILWLRKPPYLISMLLVLIACQKPDADAINGLRSDSLSMRAGPDCWVPLSCVLSDDGCTHTYTCDGRTVRWEYQLRHIDSEWIVQGKDAYGMNCTIRINPWIKTWRENQKASKKLESLDLPFAGCEYK